jgi:hypothetical protein
MRVATCLLFLVLAIAQAPLSAADGAPSSDVVLGFTGGATWTSAYTGICVWYLPLLGDEDLGSLFEAPSGTPILDREHAYFVWVSDFSVVALTAPAPFSLVLVPTGTATIYYNSNPTTRVFSNLKQRSSWGTPVATFTRKASLLRSPDGFASDTFIFSNELVSSVQFSMANGKKMDFKKLVPNGMTCFEYGHIGSSWESGVCVARGN